MTEQYSKFNFTWLIVLLALFLYVIPWVFNPGTTLSLGAYDFAEFLAKRPIDDRSYNVILILRGQLLLLTALIAFSTKQLYFTARWWIQVALCLMLVIAQLPPLTFINNTGDINQQQQALLTIGSVIIIVIGLSGLLWKQHHIIRLIISIVGVISTIYSLIHATDIMNDYGVPAHFGVGGIGLAILYLLISLKNIFDINRK